MKRGRPKLTRNISQENIDDDEHNLNQNQLSILRLGANETANDPTFMDLQNQIAELRNQRGLTLISTISATLGIQTSKTSFIENN
jgi:hypothetical protein